MMQHLTPLLISLVPWDQIAGLVLAAISAFVLPHVYTWLHVSANSKVRADLDTAMRNALTFAINRVTHKPADVLTNTVLMQSVITTAKDYVKDHVPDLVKKLGVTDVNLAQSLEARTMDVVNTVSITRGRIQILADGTTDPTKVTS